MQHIESFTPYPIGYRYILTTLLWLIRLNQYFSGRNYISIQVSVGVEQTWNEPEISEPRTSRTFNNRTSNHSNLCSEFIPEPRTFNTEPRTSKWQGWVKNQAHRPWILSGPTRNTFLVAQPSPIIGSFTKKNGQKLYYTYYSPEIRDFCFMKGSKIDETS